METVLKNPKRFIILFQFIWLPLLSFSQNSEDQAKNTYTIALLACHKQFNPAPALVKYIEMEPDLCLWIGDNIYADTKNDPSYLWKCYHALSAKPAFQLLKTKYPYMATWDDHDFGLNNEGKNYPLKDTSKSIFRQFWELEKEIPAQQDGIYYSKIFPAGDGHKLQVIMLDVRYNRDDPGGEGDVLGEDQWKWLEAQLQIPADLRLVVSGFQIMLDRSSRSETWAKFPKAQARLFSTIQNAKADRVVFIAGDQHYGEVNRMAGSLDYDAIELQFAGINQIEEPEFNSYRVSSVCKSLHSYASINIQWDSTQYDLPHLKFNVWDAEDDQLEVSYRINFNEIEKKIEFSSPKSFVNTHHIMLKAAFEGLDIRYTLNGDIPDSNSLIYQSPIVIKEAVEVKAALINKEGLQRSAVQAQYYQQVKPIHSRKIRDPKNGLTYSYYEGNFQNVPDFSGIIPKQQGIISELTLSNIYQRDDHFAISFEGYLNIPETDVYTFYLISDDGSRLLINDQLLIDNDGSHSSKEKSGSIPLEKGMHAIHLGYFEDYMGQKLELQFSTSNGIRRSIPKSWLWHNN